MPAVIIVDGYSTGRLLPSELAHFGWDTIHVMSSRSPPDCLAPTYYPELFSVNVPFEEDLDSLTELLSAFNPQYVLAGAESGVELSDQLAQQLKLPANESTKSFARRNKYEMIECVRRHGLLVADQHLFDKDTAALSKWLSTKEMPVVIKPVNSAGSDDVAYCDTPEKAIAHTKHIIGKINRLGLPNKVALAQTYLDGPQYVLNSVSMNGHAEFTDIWEIHQRDVLGGANITNYKISIDPSDPNYTPLIRYTEAALTALGVNFGAAHSEVRATQNGPALVELGARMMGATMTRELFIEAFGHSQASFWAECINSGKIHKTVNHGLSKHIALIHFNFTETGIIRAMPGLEILADLPSFRCFENPPKVGTLAQYSRDNGSKNGYCYLLNEDRTALCRDLNKYEQLCENAELFDIEPLRESIF